MKCFTGFPFDIIVSVEEALQGQLGGVDIVLGGDPGTRSSIRIRGTGTLNASADPGRFPPAIHGGFAARQRPFHQRSFQGEHVHQRFAR